MRCIKNFPIALGLGKTRPEELAISITKRLGKTFIKGLNSKILQAFWRPAIPLVIFLKSTLLVCILLLCHCTGQAQQATLYPIGQAVTGGSTIFEQVLLLDWSFGAAPAMETKALNGRYQFSM
jgi:hypothetical protein